MKDTLRYCRYFELCDLIVKLVQQGVMIFKRQGSVGLLYGLHYVLAWVVLLFWNGHQSGLNYFGSGVAGSMLWKAHYGMGFKQQLPMMTRAHIISWGHGFLRLLKAQNWPDCPTKRTKFGISESGLIFKLRPNTRFLL
ncbi:hypothetical protein HanIR_Chr14g0675361 [Helianthus annuus]|nr:hypothetical protein HanIR_Chr14g0675361 [Helianthus annuus]KAJ0654857.1 hypothetical protein HanLR1_Chr14g0511901 [Helianthus annuus]